MTSAGVVAILQARVSSTRLPGKVLEPILGEPMIVRQLARLRRSRLISHLVIATSDDSSDDDLAALLIARGETVRRGPLNDVLERFSKVVDEFEPHVMVRLTADCPLADPEVIDRVIAAHLDGGADYTSNVLDRTFPQGLDIECVTASSFARLRALSLTPLEREHVTSGIYSRPDEFSLRSVTQPIDESNLRWTVDYPSDLAFVRAVYTELLGVDAEFSSSDISMLLTQRPDLVHTVEDVA